MRSHRIDFVLMVAVLLAAASAVAVAQSTETQGSATGITQAQGSLGQSAPAGQANAEADASAKAEARVKLAAILERGAKQPAKARADADAKIQAAVNQANGQAVSEGNQKVAGRLAAEFGMTTEAVTSEKQALGSSWGELMIAHALEANSSSDLTVEQIYQMKKDGNGWGQIAAGMGFKLGDVVSAAQAEAKVAAGLAKADGKVHAIRGVDANVKSANGLGVKAGGVRADAGVKADIGVKVKP